MAPLSVLPGRLRLECEAIKGQRGRCEALGRKIGALVGVQAATANFRTGRVLVCFEEARLSRMELSSRLEELLADPALGCDLPTTPHIPQTDRIPGASSAGRHLFFDLVAHAVLPKPLDILVPAFSALRR